MSTTTDIEFDTARSAYQRHADHLEDKIVRLGSIKNQQRPDSERHEELQAEIDAVDAEWEAWRQAAPRLEQADTRIEHARRHAVILRREADNRSDSMWRAAKFMAVFGVLILMVAVIWNPHWLAWVLGLGLSGGAAGAVLYGTRSRAARYARVDQADQDVTDLVTYRDSLIPGRHTGPVHATAQPDMPDVPEQFAHAPAAAQNDGGTRRLALVPAGDGDSDGEAEGVVQ